MPRSRCRGSARAHVYQRNYVSVGNRRARSKYINFSLLQVTFLIKRHILHNLSLQEAYLQTRDPDIGGIERQQLWHKENILGHYSVNRACT